MIYVCDKCLKASCWSGKFMCDYARDAGLFRARRADILKLGLEHEDYTRDKEVIAPKTDKTTPMMPRALLRKWMVVR